MFIKDQTLSAGVVAGTTRFAGPQYSTPAFMAHPVVRSVVTESAPRPVFVPPVEYKTDPDAYKTPQKETVIINESAPEEPTKKETPKDDKTKMILTALAGIVAVMLLKE